MNLQEYIKKSFRTPNIGVLKGLGASDTLIEYLTTTPWNTNMRVVMGMLEDVDPEPTPEPSDTFDFNEIFDESTGTIDGTGISEITSSLPDKLLFNEEEYSRVNIHTEMVWLESYSEENNLWPGDDEDEDAYVARINTFFANREPALKDRYFADLRLYYLLYEIPYEGDWGGSLGDYFNPSTNPEKPAGFIDYISSNNSIISIDPTVQIVFYFDTVGTPSIALYDSTSSDYKIEGASSNPGVH